MSKSQTVYQLTKEKYLNELKQEANELKKEYGNAIETVKQRQINPPKITPKTPIIEKIVYISHPYGGNPENIAEVQRLIGNLPKKGVFAFSIFSPLHNFAFSKYNNSTKIDYWVDILRCLKFLDERTCLAVCGNWQGSLGCCVEVLYAMKNDIQVIQI